jgi:hypothetical protein
VDSCGSLRPEAGGSYERGMTVWNGEFRDHLSVQSGSQGSDLWICLVASRLYPFLNTYKDIRKLCHSKTKSLPTHDLRCQFHFASVFPTHVT